MGVGMRGALERALHSLLFELCVCMYFLPSAGLGCVCLWGASYTL